MTLRPRRSAIRTARFRSGSSAAEGQLDDVGRDASTLEVVADQRVPRALLRELLRPLAGEALVVDVPDPLERLERLLALRLADPALLQPRVQLRGRTVAEAKRAEGRLDGVRPPAHRLRRGGGFLDLLDLDSISTSTSSITGTLLRSRHAG